MSLEKSKTMKQDLRFKSIMERSKYPYEFYYSFVDIDPVNDLRDAKMRKDQGTVGHILRTLKNGEIKNNRYVSIASFCDNFTLNEVQNSSWCDFSVYFISYSQDEGTRIKVKNFLSVDYETMKNMIREWFDNDRLKMLTEKSKGKSVGVVVIHHKTDDEEEGFDNIEGRYNLTVNYSNQHEFNGKKYKIVIPFKNLSSDLKNIIDKVFQNEKHQYSYKNSYIPKISKKGKRYRRYIKVPSKITVFVDDVKIVNKFKLFGYNIPNGFIVVSKKDIDNF